MHDKTIPPFWSSGKEFSIFIIYEISRTKANEYPIRRKTLSFTYSLSLIRRNFEKKNALDISFLFLKKKEEEDFVKSKTFLKKYLRSRVIFVSSRRRFVSRGLE